MYQSNLSIITSCKRSSHKCCFVKSKDNPLINKLQWIIAKNQAKYGNFTMKLKVIYEPDPIQFDFFVIMIKIYQL